jgi:hypothetical protein
VHLKVRLAKSIEIQSNQVVLNDYRKCGVPFLQDTVMLGADFYETDAERSDQLLEGKVPIGIGENTSIQYAHIFTS